ncbi:MAG TPA: S9 family peptidase [Bryobacteraceae bacterium]|nr:S9 family peptidase [Bryobacteraceae bacterium]
MCRFCGILLLASAIGLAQKLPFSFDAMMHIARIGDPQVAPNGKTIAFTVQTMDVSNNSKLTQIYVVPLDGGSPRQITHDGSQNDRPRWTPDSNHIVYTSNRTGLSEIWMIDADGNNAKQITALSTEASGELVSPDGKKILFLSRVYPDCGAATSFDEGCNRVKLEAEKSSKVKARVYTTLLYRHWTEWQTNRRQHLMTASIDGSGVMDLTPGSHDVPPFSLGGPDDYAISPDSSEVAYAMNSDPEPAISTNSDIYVVPIGGGESKKITVNPAADNSPQYSPDGKYLAYRAQARAGYESDRWRLMVLERSTGKLTSLTEGIDRWVGSFTWSPDSTRLFFTMEDRGRIGLQMISVNGGAVRAIVSGSSSLDDVQFTRDGRTMIYTEQTGARPPEIFRATSSGGIGVAVTHLNDALLNQYTLTRLDEFWVEGAEKARVHSFLLKPPGFRAGVKYPVLFLIHGGPQSAWGEEWSYRWNAQIFAGAGYVVILPNPRGSTGYGQKFIDEINGDWGGKPFDDIMAVVDYAAAQTWADSEHMEAAGASYGGYMIDWMLGHTGRFRALVSHAGVFDLRSEAGATEELWFPIWEFHGMPWDSPELYAKWSPSFYVKNFKTPTLVTAGELDFRVPYTQDLQLYTALQLQKIPSKLLLFPDEGHWILKPQNSALWYHTVLDWLGEWIKKN